MLFALALIPAFVLMVIIYKNDKKDKEPKKLLTGLFFAGASTIVSAAIVELIGEAILDNFFYSVDELYVIVNCFLIIGPAEELGKYLILRLITWKNRHFDYSYDGIVFAVFVSMGFAAFENILYVVTGGVTTAIVRMLTAVPGHMCFAVLMGYFYSKAKYAKSTDNKKAYRKFSFLAKFIPILAHGLYDALLMIPSASNSTTIQVLSVISWIASFIVMFVICIITVVKSSHNDFCIVILENNESVVYRPSLVGGWMCSCGKENDRNFCTKCGSHRPIDMHWYCPNCGVQSFWKFCGNCGTPRPYNVEMRIREAEAALQNPAPTTPSAPSDSVETVSRWNG